MRFRVRIQLQIIGAVLVTVLYLPAVGKGTEKGCGIKGGKQIAHSATRSVVQVSSELHDHLTDQIFLCDLLTKKTQELNYGNQGADSTWTEPRKTLIQSNTVAMRVYRDHCFDDECRLRAGIRVWRLAQESLSAKPTIDFALEYGATGAITGPLLSAQEDVVWVVHAGAAALKQETVYLLRHNENRAKPIFRAKKGQRITDLTVAAGSVSWRVGNRTHTQQLS